MRTPIPTGWVSLIKTCDCIPCLAMCKAWEDAEPVVFEPAMNTVRLTLTPREIQLLNSLANGLENKEIAKLLGLHEITVKNYLSILYRKLGAHGRTQAAIIANELGVLHPDFPVANAREVAER